MSYNQLLMIRIRANQATRPTLTPSATIIIPWPIANPSTCCGRAPGRLDRDFPETATHRIRHDTSNSDRGQRERQPSENPEHLKHQPTLGQRAANDLLHRSEIVNRLIQARARDRLPQRSLNGRRIYRGPQTSRIPDAKGRRNASGSCSKGT